jgi:hypothetical protein
MSGTIWLIVEGQNESAIVRAILRHHYPEVHIERLSPPGGNPNLSRLAAKIESLINIALGNRKPGDCIAVIHDADLQTNPHDRANYERIRQVCEQYKRDVRLVIAKDEIEAWLLADAGLGGWLKIKVQNCDEMQKPSDVLKSHLDKAGKPTYRLENLSKLLRYVNGVTSSPTLQRELDYLVNAPCTKQAQS